VFGSSESSAHWRRSPRRPPACLQGLIFFFFFCVRSPSLVVLQIAGLAGRPLKAQSAPCGTGLDQVEFCLVTRKVGVDLRVGDVDLRLDLLVSATWFLVNERAVRASGRKGEIARWKLFVKLLLRVGGLHLLSTWRLHPRRWRPRLSLGGGAARESRPRSSPQDIEADNVSLLGEASGIVAPGWPCNTSPAPSAEYPCHLRLPSRPERASGGTRSRCIRFIPQRIRNGQAERRTVKSLV